MSSDFELTKEQLAFWKQEGHNDGKPSLAIIYPDGTVEMDYPDEIIKLFDMMKADDFQCDHEGYQEGDSCKTCGKILKFIEGGV